MGGHIRGKAFLLKISDGQNPPQYRTIAGLRTISESIGDEVSIKAGGIFLGSEAEGIARSRALDGTPHDYELSYDDGAKLHRRFLIQRLDYAGDYNGERNYTIHLESADGRAPLAGIPDPAAYVAAFEGMREALEGVSGALWTKGPDPASIAWAAALANARTALTAARAAMGEASDV